jgi:hypothetical protein
MTAIRSHQDVVAAFVSNAELKRQALGTSASTTHRANGHSALFGGLNVIGTLTAVSVSGRNLQFFRVRIAALSSISEPVERMTVILMTCPLAYESCNSKTPLPPRRCSRASRGYSGRGSATRYLCHSPTDIVATGRSSAKQFGPTNTTAAIHRTNSVDVYKKRIGTRVIFTKVINVSVFHFFIIASRFALNSTPAFHSGNLSALAT